jgi:site-specific DNA-methyltransferase (adenine-specific)
MIAWVYGSGFPKSHDVSKAIDREAGAEREVIGSRPLTGTARIIGGQGGATSGRADAMYETHATRDTLELTAPATPAARQWQGWGTALKPALEPITMARKPFPGTVAANVMQHGTGAVNVDGCRVGTDGGTTKGNPPKGASNGVYGHGINGACDIVPLNAGRWPANLIHDGSDEVLAGFPETKSGKMMPTRTTAGVGGRNAYGADAAGGFTTMETYGDSGSAARFFYCPKASKADREAGLEDMPSIHRPNGNKWTDQDYRVSSGERPPSAESGPRSNPHPTVKPTALMQYLCRLVTPPGGTVLDPFTGSGSTGKAAMLEGFNFVGFEREAEYVEIARRRIAEAAARPMLLEAVL